MKKLTTYRKSLLFKKLSSLNVSIITVINMFLPIISVIIGYYIAKVQLFYAKDAPDAVLYHFRVTVLCLLLSLILIGAINILFVVNPIISLENIVDEYGHLTDINDMNANENFFTTSALENMFLDMLDDQKITMKRQYQAEILRQKTELSALQSQINPHFLYNTLDSIRGLALIHDVTEISDMTEALSNLFRSMIAKEGQMITVEEEFENVSNYMIIQQFRFQNKFAFKKEIPEEVMTSYLVPNLTLQPIVENAIVHGLERKRDNGVVTVKAYCTEKRLVFNVSDNGVGISEKQLEYLNRHLNEHTGKSVHDNANNHTGIALININQRIKLEFGEEFGMTIMSTPNIYTNVEIVLPLIPITEHKSEEFV